MNLVEAFEYFINLQQLYASLEQQTTTAASA
jgi:hypothetical protein